MPHRSFVALLTAVAAAVPCTRALQAQQAPARPLFRTATQFVTADVIVTTRDDKPVTDLTVDDFRVEVDGTPQKVTDFSFVSIPVNHRAIDIDAPPPPASDIASNASSAKSSRAIVVFIDDASLGKHLVDPDGPDVVMALKRALVKFLETLTSDDQVAIVYQSRSDLSQDFTNDIARLIRSVQDRKRSISAPVPQNANPEFIGAPEPAWRAPVQSLKFAVAALRGSQVARRLIVFVGTHLCSGTPTAVGAGPSLEADECQDLYKKAREANVPIYALDPRVGAMGMDDTMAELAINTGGRAFQTMSDPLKGITDLAEENGSFYTIGFYPEPSYTDGKYHNIRVYVNRPGTIVRSREKYLADAAAAAAASAAESPTKTMTTALANGLDDSSLPVRAFIAPMAPNPRGLARTLVSVEVDYPAPDASTLKLDDDLRLGILALTTDGKIKASLQRPVHFAGTWKSTGRGTFVINDVIDLPDDQLTLRVGVTSASLRKMGSAHVTLDVPNFRSTKVQMSPIVIGGPARRVAATNGLQFVNGLVPFQPTTDRVFAATDALRIFARAYWKSSDAAADAIVMMTGPTGVAPRTLSLPVQAAEGQRTAMLDAPIPLQGLAPGTYVLSVELHVGKEKPVRREVPITIR